MHSTLCLLNYMKSSSISLTDFFGAVSASSSNVSSENTLSYDLAAFSASRCFASSASAFFCTTQVSDEATVDSGTAASPSLTRRHDEWRSPS